MNLHIGKAKNCLKRSLRAYQAKTASWFVSLFFLLVIAVPCQAEDDSWIEGMLSTMTVREKIGQMLMIDIRGTTLTPELKEFLRIGSFGNIIFFDQNITNTQQVQTFTHDLQTFSKVETGVPLMVAVDQEGGLVNRLGRTVNYPMMRYGARSFGAASAFAPDKAPALIDKVTKKIASQMKELGFNMNLAPVLDLADDNSSYIFKRSYSNDPAVVTKLAGDYSKIMNQAGIATTGKHFPNLSFTHQDSHIGLPTLDRTLTQLFMYEFVPFKNLRRELNAVMVGHILVPEIDAKYPASVSSAIIKLLRKEIGFDDVVITDDIKMKALSERYSLPEIVLRSVFADVDIILVAWNSEKQMEAVRTLERAVEKKKISIERLDRSVRRILKLKNQFARVN